MLPYLSIHSQSEQIVVSLNQIKVFHIFKIHDKKMYESDGIAPDVVNLNFRLRSGQSRDPGVD